MFNFYLLLLPHPDVPCFTVDLQTMLRALVISPQPLTTPIVVEWPLTLVGDVGGSGRVEDSEVFSFSCLKW